jgi:hypothetical protein
VARYSADIARYTMVQHKQEEYSPDRIKNVIEGPKYFKTDGLTNLK